METDAGGGVPGSNAGEDDLLQQALALSLTQQDDKSGVSNKQPDLAAMTEEEQLHYALQMSMAASAAASSTSSSSTAQATTTEKQTPVDAEMEDVINSSLFFFNLRFGYGYFNFCFVNIKRMMRITQRP
jgi:hypothetical protein